MLPLYEMCGGGFGGSVQGGDLYMPTGTLFSLWDDPNSLRISSEMALEGSAGPPMEVSGPAVGRALVLQVTTAGTWGAGVFKLSLDGGGTFPYTGIPYAQVMQVGDYTFVPNSNLAIALNKKYCTQTSLWLDKSPNAYHHGSTVTTKVELGAGPAGGVAPSRILTTNSVLLNNGAVLPQMLTLNQPMSFFCVAKIGNTTSPVYGLGAALNDCPVRVSTTTTNRWVIAKSNVVGSSSVTLNTAVSSKPTGWHFFGFSYAGGATLDYYIGMTAAPVSAAWQSTSGTHTTGGSAATCGVFSLVSGPNQSPDQLAYVSLLNVAASAGDVAAIKDSVNQRWGGAVA